MVAAAAADVFELDVVLGLEVVVMAFDVVEAGFEVVVVDLVVVTVVREVVVAEKGGNSGQSPPNVLDAAQVSSLTCLRCGRGSYRGKRSISQSRTRSQESPTHASPSW